MEKRKETKVTKKKRTKRIFMYNTGVMGHIKEFNLKVTIEQS